MRSSRPGPVALLLALVVAVISATSARALARPSIAVAPLDGDKDGAVSDDVAEAASEHGKTTKPDKVARELEKLDISALTSKSVKKLRTKLSVDVVIHGKVDRSSSKKHLELVISGAGKAKGSLDIEYRSTKDLKKALASRLGKEIEVASGGKDSGGDDEEDGESHRDSPLRGHNGDDDGKRNDDRKSSDDDKKHRDDDAKNDDDRKHDAFAKHDDDDRKRDDDKKHRDDDDRKSHDDDKKHRDDERSSKRDEDKKHRDDDDKKHRDDDDRSSKRDDNKHRGDDDDKRHKRTSSRDDEESIDSDDNEEDTGRHKKKRHHHGEHDRNPLTQAAVLLDAGAAFARRTFTYDGGGMMPPPPVGTVAPAFAISGEVYPASFSTLKGPAAGIGLAGSYDQTVGLGIAVPGTAIVAPIKNGAYWIGARYRFVFGGSSIAVGASYWRRYYMADRSKLMMPEQLDMPDVDYKAVAPDVTGRFAATPKVAVFGAVQFPLMLSSGPIQKPTSYGPSKIIAFDIRTGVEVALGSHYAVQVALGFDQIGFKFSAKMGSQAALRSVPAATDRSLGLAATLLVNY